MAPAPLTPAPSVVAVGPGESGSGGTPPAALTSRPGDRRATAGSVPQPGAEAPATLSPAPPAETPPLADPAVAAGAPTADNAIIRFANLPGEACTRCETVKLSVAPSGKVLSERGAAFAASLAAVRPVGEHVLAGDATCPAADDAGLTIEWISAERHDLLTFKHGCLAAQPSPLAETLRHAPELLSLHQPPYPWNSTR